MVVRRQNVSWRVVNIFATYCIIRHLRFITSKLCLGSKHTLGCSRGLSTLAHKCSQHNPRAHTVWFKANTLGELWTQSSDLTCKHFPSKKRELTLFLSLLLERRESFEWRSLKSFGALLKTGGVCAAEGLLAWNWEIKGAKQYLTVRRIPCDRKGAEDNHQTVETLM